MTAVLLHDAEVLADLATYVARAKRVDPDGAARLVGHGDVLAVYVSPVHGGGGPTVLGLRTLPLASAADVDVTVALAALTDRFARPVEESGPVPFSVPPAPVSAPWSGVSPPRTGWNAVGLVESSTLRTAASGGIAEVALGMPDVAGAAAVARLRAGVWGRPLFGDGGSAPDVPAGVAYAADALGFVTEGEPAALYASGPWWRLTTSRGHVLARRPAL